MIILFILNSTYILRRELIVDCLISEDCQTLLLQHAKRGFPLMDMLVARKKKVIKKQ